MPLDFTPWYLSRLKCLKPHGIKFVRYTTKEAVPVCARIVASFEPFVAWRSLGNISLNPKPEHLKILNPKP